MATFTNLAESSTSYSNVSRNSTSIDNNSKNGEFYFLTAETPGYILLEDGMKILQEQIFGDNLVSYSNATKN